ncbi:MAG: metal-dependent hydrolase [Patescibacteria group bacterium]|nr:metal-dependent hydrolase [Patescibacteria group bacterium]
MQLPSHVAVNYAVWLGVYGNTTEYLLPFIIATVILDLDHAIPFINRRRHHNQLNASGWRTRFHELYGVVLLSAIVCVVWVFNKKLAPVLALGLLLHYSADILVGESRPLYPYADTKIQVFFKKNKTGRVVLEIICMFAFIGFIIWKLFNT